MTPKGGVAVLRNGLVESKDLFCIILKRLNFKMRGKQLNQPAVRRQINALAPKYQVASKKLKSEILNSLEVITGRNRKHLIKCLKRAQFENLENRRTGRPKKYDFEDLQPYILNLWLLMGKITPKRMKAAFKDWLPFYTECPAKLRMQLNTMSSSTLSRYLREYRMEYRAKKGLSTTHLPRSAQGLKNSVPIATLDSDVKDIGHVQMDTVSHCGTSSQGPFISSLTVTDKLTCWTENRAMWGKTGKAVVTALKDIEYEIPFLLKSANGDCGSEFLNKHVMCYAKKRWKLTRSRPYKKNDNCFVEQKNFTHVRQLFGYERLDEEVLVDLMNEIYTQYWNPLQNYFLPNLKLIEKVQIGSKIKKKYDEPKTPYERLLQSGQLHEEDQKILIETKSKLNPFELRRGLDIKLKEFEELLRKETTGEIAA